MIQVVKPFLSLKALRTALWHLRNGGVKQLRDWVDRTQYEAGVVTPRNVRGVEAFWTKSKGETQLSFPAFDLTSVSVSPEIRIGIVADPFTLLAFEPEATLVQLAPDMTVSDLEVLKLDLVLVESAWNANGGRWAGKIAGSHGSDSQLRQLIDAAKALGVPTAFWNKEDPVHFEDFIEAAQLFEAVFTTDSDCIPEYLERLDHRLVLALPFAVQPQIHNPVRPKRGWHERDVMFAGMFFRDKFQKRAQRTDQLLTAGQRVAGPGLDIFARHSGTSQKYRVPEKYQSHVVGELDYQRMLSAYRAYKVTLNVNTVEESPTMCSRRALEAVACGSAVVSSPAKGIDTLLGGHLVTVDNERTAEQAISKALIVGDHESDAAAHRARRELWRHHTYQHRLNDILQTVGLVQNSTPISPSLSALLVTMRPWQLDFALKQLLNQNMESFQLVIVAHGFDVDASAVRRKLGDSSKIADLQIWEQPRSDSLGACLNRAVSMADGSVVSKFDDDDYYGPEYFSDLLDAKQFSGAALVGKQAHFVKQAEHPGLSLMYPRQEHCYSRLVMGPTLTGDRELFEDMGFGALAIGEDTDFQRRAVAAGVSIYSADRFNYVMNRRSSGHTWQMETERMKSRESVYPDLEVDSVLSI